MTPSPFFSVKIICMENKKHNCWTNLELTNLTDKTHLIWNDPVIRKLCIQKQFNKFKQNFDKKNVFKFLKIIKKNHFQITWNSMWPCLFVIQYCFLNSTWYTYIIFYILNHWNKTKHATFPNPFYFGISVCLNDKMAL